ncbi:TlpA family protein disulfide reductase [Mucilaginibacter litoreus]|uniref:TlpA family protein disulfide reductase n=1 Tax=Mucilaginibacter litoreus TaxID=1048221 RepID=A0ABW3AS39_9SPHI
MINLLFIAALIIILFFPPAKALLIRGGMHIGLFQPEVTEQKVPDGPVAEDIILEVQDGKAFHLSDLKGKIVFMNFWATWCPPCIAEMPSINSLRKEFKGKVVFIMVDIDNDLGKSVEFMRDRNYDLQVYRTTSSVKGNLASKVIPSSFIINQHGQIVFHHKGAADYSNTKLTTFLNKLLLSN